MSRSQKVSKWVGESAKLVRTLFDTAREKAPSVVFIDEIDSLCRARGGDKASESTQQILTEFLIQMQGCGSSQEGVLVIAATNLPWDLDSAILSRFQKKVYIPLPEETTRRAMLDMKLAKVWRHDLEPEHVTMLAHKTHMFSARDLDAMVKQAMQVVSLPFLSFEFSDSSRLCADCRNGFERCFVSRGAPLYPSNCFGCFARHASHTVLAQMNPLSGIRLGVCGGARLEEGGAAPRAWQGRARICLGAVGVGE